MIRHSGGDHPGESGRVQRVVAATRAVTASSLRKVFGILDRSEADRTLDRIPRSRKKSTNRFRFVATRFVDAMVNDERDTTSVRADRLRVR